MIFGCVHFVNDLIFGGFDRVVWNVFCTLCNWSFSKMLSSIMGFVHLLLCYCACGREKINPKSL